MSIVNFDKIVTSIYVLDNNLSENEQVKDEQLRIRVSEYDVFLAFAKKMSKEVFLILGEPQGPEFNPLISVRKNLDSYVDVAKIREGYKTHYTSLNMLNEIKDVKIIDPIKYLCSDVCNVMDDNLDYFYKDGSHMRPFYAIRELSYLN